MESLPDQLHPGSASPLQCPTHNSSSLVTNQNSSFCFLSGFLMEPESHLLPGYCFVSSNLQAVQAPTFAFMSPGGTCVVPAMSVLIPRVPDAPQATPLSQHSLGWASLALLPWASSPGPHCDKNQVFPLHPPSSLSHHTRTILSSPGKSHDLYNFPFTNRGREGVDEGTRAPIPLIRPACNCFPPSFS